MYDRGSARHARRFALLLARWPTVVKSTLAVVPLVCSARPRLPLLPPSAAAAAPLFAARVRCVVAVAGGFAAVVCFSRVEDRARI
jgi:hypothetical protein